jgi:hypothetical protein
MHQSENLKNMLVIPSALAPTSMKQRTFCKFVNAKLQAIKLQNRMRLRLAFCAARKDFTMRARPSFWAMLGQDTFVGPQDVFQGIREAMLGALARFCEHEFSLQMDITNARDLSDLWYLRPRLLAPLKAHNIPILLKKKYA